MAYSNEQKLALLRYNGIDDSRINALTDEDFDDLLRRAGGNMPTIEGNPTENQAENAEQVQEDYNNRIAQGEEQKIAAAQDRAPWEQSVHDSTDRMRQELIDLGYTENQADRAARVFYGQNIHREPGEKDIDTAYREVLEWKRNEYGRPPNPPKPTGKPAQQASSGATEDEVQQFYQSTLEAYGDPGLAGQAANKYTALRGQGMSIQEAMAQAGNEFAPKPTPEPTPPPDPTPQPTPEPEPPARIATTAEEAFAQGGTEGLRAWASKQEAGTEWKDDNYAPGSAQGAFDTGGTDGLRAYAAKQEAGTEASDPNYSPVPKIDPPVQPPQPTPEPVAPPVPEDGASSLDNPAPGSADAVTPTQPTTPPNPQPPKRIADETQFNDDWANLNEQQRIEVFNSSNPTQKISEFKRQPDPESGTWKAPVAKKPTIPTGGQDKIAGTGGAKIVGDGEKPTFDTETPNTPDPFVTPGLDTPDTEPKTEVLPPAPKPATKIGSNEGLQPFPVNTENVTTPIQTYKPSTALSDKLQTYFQGRIGQSLDSYGPSDDYIQRRKDLEAKRIADAYDSMYDNVRMDAINSGVYNGDAKIAGLFNVGNDQLDRLADQGESIELGAIDRRIADRNTSVSQAMTFDSYDRELDRAISNDNWSNVEDLLYGVLGGFDDLKDWWKNRNSEGTKPTDPGDGPGQKEPGDGKGEPPPVIPPPIIPPTGTEPPPIGEPPPPVVVDPPFIDPGNPFEDDPFVGGGPNDPPPGTIGGNGNVNEEIIIEAENGNPSGWSGDEMTIEQLNAFGTNNVFELHRQGGISDALMEQYIDQAPPEVIDNLLNLLGENEVGINDEPFGEVDPNKVINKLEGATEPVKEVGGRIADAGGDLLEGAGEVVGEVTEPFVGVGEDFARNAARAAGEGLDALEVVIPEDLAQQAVDSAEPILNKLSDIAEPAKNVINTAVDRLITGNMPNISLGDMDLDKLGQSAMTLGVAWKIINGDFSGAAKQAGMNALWSWMGTMGVPVGPIQLAIASVPILRNVLSESKEQTVALPSYRVDPSQMDAELFGEIEYAISEGEKFGYDDLPQEQIQQMLMSGEIALTERDLRDMVSTIYGEGTQLEDVVGNSEFIEGGAGRHGGYGDPNYNVNSPYYNEDALRTYASNNPQRINNIRRLFDTQSGVGQGARIAS